jgi:hypothetical protein
MAWLKHYFDSKGLSGIRPVLHGRNFEPSLHINRLITLFDTVQAMASGTMKWFEVCNIISHIVDCMQILTARQFTSHLRQ